MQKVDPLDIKIGGKYVIEYTFRTDCGIATEFLSTEVLDIDLPLVCVDDRGWRNIAVSTDETKFFTVKESFHDLLMPKRRVRRSVKKKVVKKKATAE